MSPRARAVIECPQEIPCNPCEQVCRTGAIEIGPDITAVPRLDPAKCNGCTLCVAICPGLAIYLLEEEFAPGMAAVSFPHEYLPLPAKGDRVPVVDGEGCAVAEGEVLRVSNPASFTGTPVVRVSVPSGAVSRVRGIAVRRDSIGG